MDQSLFWQIIEHTKAESGGDLPCQVVLGGRVAYLRGLGRAGPGRAVQPETPFILGSRLKSFRVLAIMGQN
ncbi:MAG: hypothetical protein ABI413_02200 [Ktedonobacteraceae bacterium]